jgi:Flp pilus assembly protein TadG
MTQHFRTFRIPESVGLNLIRSDQRGVSIVEFGLVAPMFFALMMAVFDLGFGVYTKAVIQGEIEKAARSASLENTSWAVITGKVNDQIKAVIPSANSQTDISFAISNEYYEDYNDLQLPEAFNDDNNNSRWDSSECYVDRNGNRKYDTDVGLGGRGGAQDVVKIEANVTYKRVFPLWSLVGMPNTQTIQASTYLRNQPFQGQLSRVGVRICPAP